MSIKHVKKQKKNAVRLIVQGENNNDYLQSTCATGSVNNTIVILHPSTQGGIYRRAGVRNSGIQSLKITPVHAAKNSQSICVSTDTETESNSIHVTYCA